MKIIITTFTTSVVVLLVCFAGPVSAQQPNGYTELTRAQELYQTGNWETAKEAYDDALKVATDEKVKTEANLGQASILWEQGFYTPAYAKAKTALKLAKSVKYNAVVSRLMLTLGHIEAATGKYGKASATLKACEVAARRQKDETYQILCRTTRRFVRQLQGKKVGSNAMYEKDLRTLKSSGDHLLIGTALSKTADLRHRGGNPAAALALLQSAHTHFKASGSKPAVARNKLRLADTFQSMEQWASSAKLLDGLVIELANMNNTPAMVTAHALMGRQLHEQGDAIGSLRHLKKAQKLAKKIESPPIRANVELSACQHFMREKKLKKARQSCSDAASAFRKIGAWSLVARAEINSGRSAHEAKDLKSARQHYATALDVLEKKVSSSSRPGRDVAQQYANLCQIELEMKANGTASRCKTALKKLKKIKSPNTEDQRATTLTQYALGMTSKGKSSVAMLTAAGDGFVLLKDSVRASDAYVNAGVRAKTAKAGPLFEKAHAAVDGQTGAAIPVANRARIQLAQWYLGEGRLAESEKLLTTLVSSLSLSDHSNRAWVAQAQAKVFLKTNRRAESIAALRQCTAYAKKATDAELAASCKSQADKLNQ